MFGRKIKIVDPYNTMGNAPKPRRSEDPLKGVTRRPSGIWLTPKAHAAYEAAVRQAMQAYDEGRTAAYEEASMKAGDILYDPRNQVDGPR